MHALFPLCLLQVYLYQFEQTLLDISVEVNTLFILLLGLRKLTLGGIGIAQAKIGLMVCVVYLDCLLTSLYSLLELSQLLISQS